MKIALVILHADPRRGGAERYTFDLAGALAARGHEVALVASSFGNQPTSATRVELTANAITRLGKYTRFLDALDAHLRDHSYDVVHAMLPVRQCDFYHPHAGLAAESIATGHLKHPTAFGQFLARMGNRLNLKRLKFASVERSLLQQNPPPVVLCLSEYVKSAVRRHFPLPDDRLALLFNGIDIDRFQPREAQSARPPEMPAWPENAVVALIIAQDFQRKGLGPTILALHQLADPRLRLIVVGKEDPSAYQALARTRGVEDRIWFAGATADPRPFYHAADFFVLPTRHDPCSLVVLEALAAGLPVISTKLNGACEIMTTGRHGVVLDNGDDIPALANAMRQMLDPALRESMSHACISLRPRLSQQRHVDELLRLYAAKR